MIHAATDEVLERLWYAAEEARTPIALTDFRIDISESDLREALGALVEGGWIENAGGYKLTSSGATRARGIVRRHRLAEVLFVQALGTNLHDAEVSACEMEHMLSEPVVDRVCAFLGHPPACPHGKPVPAGECCRVYSTRVEPLIRRVTELPVGATAWIAYIAPKTLKRIDRLAAFGIVPGSEIRLIARNPSCVVACGASSIALDDEIGREIYVRCA
ncbi:MAG: DtxR family transcriptional regulator, Mn-dependent transcriptional regulator [Thermoanaerobaculia bacterium]|jgi:DtxR family Mn-dependent transcriptional regulator|nr:DtxR family transcriptional regulator, Mn-dependent transcriptional regulator [Thermoanaerobaculia bacterium]